MKGGVCCRWIRPFPSRVIAFGCWMKISLIGQRLRPTTRSVFEPATE